VLESYRSKGSFGSVEGDGALEIGNGKLGHSVRARAADVSPTVTVRYEVEVAGNARCSAEVRRRDR
jgi:hypothetical protein